MSEIDWQTLNQRLLDNQSQLSEHNSREIQFWPDLLERRAQQLADRKQLVQKSQKTFLVCQLQTERYALALTQLKEIAPFKTCTFLPLAPPSLLGIYNQRGVMVSVLELADLLGLSAHPSRCGEGYLLFLRSVPPVALRVDAIGDFLHFEEQALIPCPKAPFLQGLVGDVQILNLSALSHAPLLQSISLASYQEQE
ncbi:hypothetical protein COW36_07120 [bacterium (Candidatus Blackallbacteria) CG17_big_fil_post_rev_8_21_14_2_50_48_46]|uniref:CheW-like domain-containing protein n=1 Tax=bacterium (Candidatus Blackallbacteria) CG17_big_fil_post_rev_8_21_14_2_50_48_46 TaxID=2014261 RepID=A0A2M7G703_9BACT|nr:MAG: hypothetical protein COW64_06630 [bacterium (Candidatus Blackallbacteria) CG18_big_fil_WC_8_21_14_2_50_49_26]PIW17832.1 MAG: hypothetical protein COW36_07120 [bacterium (Candidatus Blackallbacteria) CG17_big_fil_post_rev_8_21_14_2_50_48_46]PIW48508.1 MAG: hypothetical protein COW20_09075 [bacterium (Candidatus Blackallbacteria) CG13_big_fil_rev_8_21_14_2_50_49_14]